MIIKKKIKLQVIETFKSKLNQATDTYNMYGNMNSIKDKQHSLEANKLYQVNV